MGELTISDIIFIITRHVDPMKYYLYIKINKYLIYIIGILQGSDWL